MRAVEFGTLELCRLVLRNRMLRDSIEALVRAHRSPESSLLDVVAEGVVDAPRQQLLFLMVDGAPSTSSAAHAILRVQLAPDVGYVSLVHTAAAMRRRGLSARLLATAIRRCRGRTRALELDVVTDNVAAKAMYENAGFVAVGTRGCATHMALKI